jgi:hypothetical protein
MAINDEGYQIKMREWKDATWQFVLEHCKILPSGKIRVIFDTDSQHDLEKRIWARYKNIYHRGDYKAVQQVSKIKLKKFRETKEEKKARYKADKKNRKKAQKMKSLTLLQRIIKIIFR